ncbi:MAG TPA: GTPase ObgE [Syntrophobacteraceae bacterium]|nr:GTPase ObgE [Syntrophobacteraceae bacterium]
MKFVDEVKITVRAGKGGNGCVSFRREKYVPRGGPDGGDGGNGGSVLLTASRRKHTLLDFHYRHLFRAPAGKHGQGQNKHGRGGRSLVLEVPVGTLVKDAVTGEVLVDLDEPGQSWTAVRGGTGGRGNARFVSSVRQVPREAEEGREGEERDLVLELKLMADAGLVGLPNAGKSTLIAAVSAARPKIADYPFTTLVPHLGVVRCGEFEPFVWADIPGLIRGAHQGTGLGIRFLRHIDRTRLLVHVIDGSALPSEDLLDPYRQVESELSRYSEEMGKKLRIIVINKTDLLPDPRERQRIADVYATTGHKVLLVSALQRRGTDALVRLVAETLSKLRDAQRISAGFPEESEGCGGTEGGRQGPGTRRRGPDFD